MLRLTRAPAAAREVAAVPTRPLPKAAPGPPGPKLSGSASLRRRDPRRPSAARRRPPKPARLPARGETHSSDHQERTWRPQPWAWESLFGVLQQCLRSRVSPSLPPRKPGPFPRSLGLQHDACCSRQRAGSHRLCGSWLLRLWSCRASFCICSTARPSPSCSPEQLAGSVGGRRGMPVGLFH
ncbi:uncharacterized protein [Symphalangus syndactylus]|uniref:uncharacterized protein n=1 Tax=Symphalangus syndactylus TaxID=9590 RepID=UPI003003C049